MNKYIFKATCTWGEGPDIILEFPLNPQASGFNLVQIQGGHSVGLTLEQAESLLDSLQGSIEQAKEYEKLYIEDELAGEAEYNALMKAQGEAQYYEAMQYE